MTIEYILDTENWEWATGTGNHTIVTETGQIVSQSDYGITLSDGIATDVTASAYGFVSGQIIGINYETTNATIHIGSAGHVHGGTKGAAIGQNGVVENAGQITGDQKGIFIG